MPSTLTLQSLLDHLDPDAPLAQRHIWLLALLRWLTSAPGTSEAAQLRLRLLLDTLEANAHHRERVRRWWERLVETVDATVLLADYGFAQRLTFSGEFFTRLRRKLFPATPETTDSAELFALALPRAAHAAWLLDLDAATLARLSHLLSTGSPELGVTHWQHELLEALHYCGGQISACGFMPEVRQRMSAPARQMQPFHSIGSDVEAFRQAFTALPRSPQAVESAARQLRERLDTCRAAASHVYRQLDAQGISVDLVFMLRQLRERTARADDLMDTLLSPHPEAACAQLLARLAALGEKRSRLTELVSSSVSLLTAKVTQRSAEVGEHYITRTRTEYDAMVRKAGRGGAVMAATTWLKFMLAAMGLAAFWSGFWIGLLYAASFVLIQLLHGTLATKQPAMTAPALASRLKDLDQPGQLDAFVDDVACLVRSQVAGILGNVALVMPCVLLLAWAAQAAGAPGMIDRAHADAVLQSLHPFNLRNGVFAVFTGLLLFASSLIAGWVENWFVLHRLDSVLRYHPRATALLGPARADRWAGFLRDNISGFAANISLGFMLGLLPVVLGFFGVPAEVRHVTLAAGQLAAAAATYGSAAISMGSIWACLATVALIGVLNVAVSFYLAFQLALRATHVGGGARSRIRSALLSRLRRQPGSFFRPS